MKLQMIFPLLAVLISFQADAQPASGDDKGAFPIEALLPKSKLSLSSSIFRNARVPETFKGQTAPRLVVGYTGDELLISYDRPMSFSGPGGAYWMEWDFRSETQTQNNSNYIGDLNQGYMELTNLIKKVNKYAKWGSRPHAYTSYAGYYAGYDSKSVMDVATVVQKINQNLADSKDPSCATKKIYHSALLIMQKTWTGFLRQNYSVARPEHCAIYFAPGQDQSLPGVIDSSGLDRTLTVKSIHKSKDGFITINLLDPKKTVTRLVCQDISNVGQLYKLMDSNIDGSIVDVKKYFREY